MKKIFFLALFFSFLFVFITPTVAIDRQTLWTKLNFAGSLDQYLETKLLAKQNIGLIEEILFFSDMQGDTSSARFNSLRILKESAETGIITKDRFLSTVLRLYNQISSIAHPSRLTMSKNQIVGTLAALDQGAPLNSSFTTLSTLTSSLSSAGLIKNSGITNSLTQKISNAQKSFEQKGPSSKQTAINQVEAAINELNAQNGKGISEDGCQILTGYCRNLISKIQSAAP